MYYCPTCGAGFEESAQCAKHYLACWREKHPNHKPKDAPRSEDIVTRKVSPQMQAFFERMKPNG